MATVTMTAGHRYKFAASAGSPVLLESSDNVGDVNYFHNQVHIEDIEGTSNAQLTVKSNNGTTQYGPTIFCWNTGAGDAGICFRTDSAYWSVGSDNDQSNRFSIGNSSNIGSTLALTIDTSNEDVMIHNTLRVDNIIGTAGVHDNIDFNDCELREIKSLQLQDWDDDTNTDNTVRVIRRDGKWNHYDGSVTIGQYENGDTMVGQMSADGDLAIKGKLYISTGAGGTDGFQDTGATKILIETTDDSGGLPGNETYAATEVRAEHTAWWKIYDEDAISTQYAIYGYNTDTQKSRWLNYDGSDWEGWNMDNDGDFAIHGSYSSSDRRLKTNIKYLTGSAMDAISIVKQLKAVSFDWIKYNKPVSASYGYIADEVEPILPGVVNTATEVKLYKSGSLLEDGTTWWVGNLTSSHDQHGNALPEEMGNPIISNKQSINYSALIPILSEAIKEQQDIIEDLKTRIISLENA